MYAIYVILFSTLFWVYHCSMPKNYDMVDEYNIELLVVIDPFVKNLKLVTNSGYRVHILRKIKKAAEIFKNYDIGNKIQFSVYNVMDHHIDTTSRDSSTILKAFCKWQKKRFSSEEHKLFDYALYFTPNVTDGISLASFSRCDLDSKCAIINFHSERLANYMEYTIAHELGHSLNAEHDDDAECIDHNKEISNLKEYVMWPITEGGLMWSPCSKNLINNFLKSEYSFCLHNKPKTDLLSSIKLELLPFRAISRTKLCNFLIDSSFYFNYKVKDTYRNCTTITCHNREGKSFIYKNIHFEILNGLECGKNEFCFEGKCVKKRNIKPINGGWSDWVQDSKCSLKCGGGVRLTKRSCTEPVPKYGGHYCSGESTKFEMCNLNPCKSLSSTRIRDLQCADKQSTYVSSNPCALFCKNDWKMRVEDGTPCYQNFTGKCLGGYCRPADCNSVIFGNAKEDLCGNCNGKKFKCYLHQKTDLPVPLPKSTANKFAGGMAYEIVRIPKGSASIVIELRNKDSQFTKLSLKTRNGKLNPNTDKVQTYPMTFRVGDYSFDYNHLDNGKYQIIKSIMQQGTTIEDIYIYVLDYHLKGAKSISFSWYNNKKTQI